VTLIRLPRNPGHYGWWVIHVARSSLVFLGLLLLVVETLVAPHSLAAPGLDTVVVHRYGPIVIYSDGNVSLLLFDEGFFNFTYRNVYVYITRNSFLIEGLERIGDFYSDIDKYFLGNPYIILDGNLSNIQYSTASATNVKGEYIAKYIDEQMGRPMALAVGDYGDTILVATGSIKGTGEDARLLEAGRNISSMYGKRVEIISVSPFSGFFNRRYNGSAICPEALEAVKGIGLENTLIGCGVWIPAFRIYAPLQLNVDKLDEIAKNNNTDTETLVKKIIDAIRERVPEDIPLSIIVTKPGNFSALPATNNNSNNGNTMSITTVAAATIALIPLAFYVTRRIHH